MDNRSELLSPSIAPNPRSKSRRPVLAIVGPTASGKSSLALFLAQRFGGEIVNYDSVQVYQGLDIGSAKTPVGERCGIPHHLLDLVPPWSDFNAGDYARHARQVMAAIHQRQKLPILVGGTGLYLRALLEGLSPAPARDDVLRQRLSATAHRRPNLLHRYLSRFDSVAAARIHPNDHQKLIRAVELTRLNGSASQTATRERDRLDGVSVLKIGLDPPRAAVYQRIDRRAAAMFQGGLLAETQAILHSAPPGAALRSLGSLGYRQALLALAGSWSVAQAVEDTQRKTRQYAKRQWTWFRADSEVHWLAGFGDYLPIKYGGEKVVANFMERQVSTIFPPVFCGF